MVYWRWIVDTKNNILAVAHMGIRKFTGVAVEGHEVREDGSIRVTVIIPKNMGSITDNVALELKRLGKEASR